MQHALTMLEESKIRRQQLPHGDITGRHPILSGLRVLLIARPFSGPTPAHDAVFHLNQCRGWNQVPHADAILFAHWSGAEQMAQQPLFDAAKAAKLIYVRSQNDFSGEKTGHFLSCHDKIRALRGHGILMAPNTITTGTWGALWLKSLGAKVIAAGFSMDPKERAQLFKGSPHARYQTWESELLSEFELIAP